MGMMPNPYSDKPNQFSPGRDTDRPVVLRCEVKNYSSETNLLFAYLPSRFSTPAAGTWLVRIEGVHPPLEKGDIVIERHPIRIMLRCKTSTPHCTTTWSTLLNGGASAAPIGDVRCASFRFLP